MVDKIEAKKMVEITIGLRRKIKVQAFHGTATKIVCHEKQKKMSFLTDHRRPTFRASFLRTKCCGARQKRIFSSLCGRHLDGTTRLS